MLSPCCMRMCRGAITFRELAMSTGFLYQRRKSSTPTMIQLTTFDNTPFESHFSCWNAKSVQLGRLWSYNRIDMFKLPVAAAGAHDAYCKHLSVARLHFHPSSLLVALVRLPSWLPCTANSSTSVTVGRFLLLLTQS